MKKPKGKRVRLKDSYDYTGTVTQTGDEQTEVRWDEGYTMAVPNHWLEEAK